MKGSDVLEKPPVPLSLAAADNAKGTVPAQQLDRRATASAKAGAGGAGNRNTTPVDFFAATPRNGHRRNAAKPGVACQLNSAADAGGSAVFRTIIAVDVPRRLENGEGGRRCGSA